MGKNCSGLSDHIKNLLMETHTDVYPNLGSKVIDSPQVLNFAFLSWYMVANTAVYNHLMIDIGSLSEI